MTIRVSRMAVLLPLSRWNRLPWRHLAEESRHQQLPPINDLRCCLLLHGEGWRGTSGRDLSHHITAQRRAQKLGCSRVCRRLPCQEICVAMSHYRCRSIAAASDSDVRLQNKPTGNRPTHAPHPPCLKVNVSHVKVEDWRGACNSYPDCRKNHPGCYTEG